MIIAKFYGGLGNQLFQYAFAKSLQECYDLPLKADVSFYSTDSNRSFILDKLGIEIELANEQEISDLHWNISKKANLFKKKRHHLLQEQEESYFSFDETHYQLDHPKGIFIDGYWQHPKYLSTEIGIAEKCNLQLIEFDYSQLLAELRSCESVSIHVRRGDYINDKHTNEVHGICSYQHYLMAIDWLNAKLENPKYFIFSDDIDWCKKKFTGDNFKYVSNPGVSDWIDLALMMNCQHHIIANSSFSWWAAWLNKNPEKRVLAPRKWFKRGNWDTSELIPAQWHRI